MGIMDELNLADNDPIMTMQEAAAWMEIQLRISAAAFVHSFISRRKALYEEKVERHASSLPPTEARRYRHENYYFLWPDNRTDGKRYRISWIIKGTHPKSKKPWQKWVPVGKDGATQLAMLMKRSRPFERELVASAEHERMRLTQLWKHLRSLQKCLDAMSEYAISTAMWVDHNNIGRWRLIPNCLASPYGKEMLASLCAGQAEFADRYVLGCGDSKADQL